VSSLQLNDLTKISRSRESSEQTEAGVQIALDEVDHFEWRSRRESFAASQTCRGQSMKVGRGSCRVLQQALA
jgi:hypothetical protein